MLETARGGFLWDCLSLIDDQTVEQVNRLGGLKAIAISHPHYYTSMVEWSRAFGGIPIYLHEDDREWVQFHDPAIKFWSGETHSIAEDLTLIRLGTHFKGFQALHWAFGDGVLMSGDMPQVCPDRRYLSFMYSYPNFVPLSAAVIRGIVQTLEGFGFDRIYGAVPGWIVPCGAKDIVKRSAERYTSAISA